MLPSGKCCVGVGFVVDPESGEEACGGLPPPKELEQCCHQIRINCFQPTECLIGDTLKRLLCTADAGR